MNHHNGRPFFLLLISVAILLLISLLPTDRLEDYGFKSVRLLSDITVEETDDSTGIILAEIPEIKEAEEVCPPGIFPIEDFSEGEQYGMMHFYHALNNRDNLDRPVRIAYFGDSFIEGDIFTADLRDMLQEEFGGCGAGYTDMAPPFAGFRRALPLQSWGWDTRNTLMKDSCERHRLGPTQRYAMPRSGASTDLKATNFLKNLNRFETSTLYLKSYYPVSVKARMNGDSTINFKSKGNGHIETLSCENDMKRIRWTVNGDSTVTCYGVAIEGKRGITLDNFSFRGSSGLSLGYMSQRQWSEWSKVRPYDLIVLHFGLNVAQKKGTNYEGYQQGLTSTIEKLKKAYPNTSFLIVGVSDREGKIKGELHTYPGVKALIQYQRLTAAQNKIAFWNLYEAMGGEGSIVAMTKTDPRGARTDYTHITREGGRTLAKILFDSMVYCYEKNSEKANSYKEVPVTDNDSIYEDFEFDEPVQAIETDSIAEDRQESETDSISEENEFVDTDTTVVEETGEEVIEEIDSAIEEIPAVESDTLNEEIEENADI